MNSDYAIPIVQGTAVPSSQPYVKNSYEPTATATGYTEETTTFGNDFSPQQQQQQQPNQFQDVIWAIAFVIHLVGMIGLISVNIANADGGNNAAGSFTGVYTLIGIAVASSVGIATGSVALMMRYPTEMVKAGLFFSVFLTGAMALMLILAGGLFGALVGVFFFVITICYARSVWPRIPFAAGELGFVFFVWHLGWQKCLFAIVSHRFHFVRHNSQPQDCIECRQSQHGTWCCRLSSHDRSLRMEWFLVGRYARSFAK